MIKRKDVDPWQKFGIADIIIYIVLAMVVLATAFPFWNAVVLSFNEGRDAQTGGIYFWPRAFTLDNYKEVFADGSVWTAYLVTIARAVLGVVTTLIVTSMFSYALSKPNLKFRKFYMILVLISMYFNGGIIPTYLVIRDLQLLDTFWVYVVMWMFNQFYALVFISFFKGIPVALTESAKLDGASEFRIYRSIILPLSKPVIAAVTLFVAVNHWNAWQDNMLYVRDESLTTLSFLFVKMIRSQAALESVASEIGDVSMSLNNVSTTTLSLATMVVATIPILCVYPFVQRYFTSGIMIGSVKG